MTTSQQSPHPAPASITYTMEELTALTGVTARTVRYYITEGLLPPPDGAGPATTYTDRHRNRLQLIGALKNAYLPLKEIRRRLARMRDEEIATAVASHDEAMPLASTPNDMTVEALATDDAAAYIDRLLEPRIRSTSFPQSPPHRPVPAPASASLRRELHAPDKERPQASPTPNWKRLPITSDAELMIEEETFHRRQEQIEAALDWLRRILNGS